MLAPLLTDDERRRRVTSALDAISVPAERAHEQEVMRELVGD
jgi:hypothetical protein